jgi:hypothetical protein
MPRRLLNVASIVCLVACVALMGLWVQSYWWMDDLQVKPLGTFSVGCASSMGRVAIGIMSGKINPNDGWFRSPVGNWKSELARIDQRFSTVAGFGLVYDGIVFAIMVPDWFVVLSVGALSFASWRRVKY